MFGLGLPGKTSRFSNGSFVSLEKNYRSKSCSVFCRIAEQINYFQVIFVVLSNQKREVCCFIRSCQLTWLEFHGVFVERKPTTFSHQPGGIFHRLTMLFLAWNDHPVRALGRPERRFLLRGSIFLSRTLENERLVHLKITYTLED